MYKLKNLYKKIINLVFPPRCPGCGTVDVNSVGLCKECYEKYTNECLSKCPVCGKRALDCVCQLSKYSSSFLKDRRSLTLTFYMGYSHKSDRVTEKLLYSYKRKYNKDLIDLFARDISVHLIKLTDDKGKKTDNFILTYPPRSSKNIMEYGFDHAEMTVKRISYYTGLPYEKILYRSGGGEQKALGASQREQNADCSMYIMKRDSVRDRYVILFDDIITTGSTMRAASNLLLDAGAKAVFPVSIAKTPIKP